VTFYIPSFVLIVFCSAVIIHAFCVLGRQSSTLQRRHNEHFDAKLGLLPTSGSACVELESTRLHRRKLTVLTLLMVSGVLSWGCGAAAAVLERRTLAGTVVASFYAVCTSTVALLLFLAHQSRFATTWKTLTRRCCQERLTNWRNLADQRTDGEVAGQPIAAVPGQVVYSIASSVTSTFHLCATPAIDANYKTDEGVEELVALGMRDCTGSSCSVPASLFPVSVAGCEECTFCRSATDSSTGGRSFSRNSLRMKDFDDLSLSSDEENYDASLEGGCWNSKVDIHGCSIHRAPCPSPASACSSGEDRCSESGLSPEHARCKRRWSVMGASPETSKKPERRRHEEETQHIVASRRGGTKYRRGREYGRSLSTNKCSTGLMTHYKRRRVSSKTRQNYCHT